LFPALKRCAIAGESSARWIGRSVGRCQFGAEGAFVLASSGGALDPPGTIFATPPAVNSESELLVDYAAVNCRFDFKH
jgi:hypothetical protein